MLIKPCVCCLNPTLFDAYLNPISLWQNHFCRWNTTFCWFLYFEIPRVLKISAGEIPKKILVKPIRNPAIFLVISSIRRPGRRFWMLCSCQWRQPRGCRSSSNSNAPRRERCSGLWAMSYLEWGNEPWGLRMVLTCLNWFNHSYGCSWNMNGIWMEYGIKYMEYGWNSYVLCTLTEYEWD